MGETLQYSIVVSHIANAMKNYIFKGALSDIVQVLDYFWTNMDLVQVLDYIWNNMDKAPTFWRVICSSLGTKK